MADQFSKRGFTLIEVMIGVIIFALLAVAGTEFLIQAMRSSNQVSIRQDARQNANAILGMISASVRAANCLDWGYSGNPGGPSNDLIVKTYSDNCNTEIDRYTFQYSTGQVTKYNLPTNTTTTISSQNIAALSCGVSGATCGQTQQLGTWLRPDGRTPTGRLSGCFKRLYAGANCGGQLLGFGSCGTCTDGLGQCVELLSPGASVNYGSLDNCNGAGQYCGVAAKPCSSPNTGGSAQPYTSAIFLQWVGTGAPLCLNGVVVNGGQAATGQVSSLPMQMTMQNVWGPSRPDQCASVTVSDTITPRLTP